MVNGRFSLATSSDFVYNQEIRLGAKACKKRLPAAAFEMFNLRDFLVRWVSPSAPRSGKERVDRMREVLQMFRNSGISDSTTTDG